MNKDQPVARWYLIACLERDPETYSAFCNKRIPMLAYSAADAITQYKVSAENVSRPYVNIQAVEPLIETGGRCPDCGRYVIRDSDAQCSVCWHWVKPPQRVET